MKQSIKLFAVLILFFFASCGTNTEKKDTATKELLIYCGSTMSKPISEIAKIIEVQENCKIQISIGGSGNLYKSILANKIGDLYLPGSETYVKTGFDENIITDTVFVGINKAVIMVKKGNPKNISNISDLANLDYRVIIGDPNSGSIGKETKKILDKKELFDKVSENAIHLTIDSKDLILSLKNDEADIIINWYAPYTWDNNKDFIDLINIDKEYAKQKNLYLSLLTYSKYPDIAKKIMEYAKSKEGQNIFKKYGLNN